MKKILTLVGIVAMLGAFATASFAQKPGPGGQGGKTGSGKGPGGPGGPGQGRGLQMRKMQGELLAKLGLSADQKAKIAALDKKYQADMQALMKNGNPRDNMDKFRALSKTHREAVGKVLTAAQKAKYEQLMKEMREKMMKDRGGKGPGGPGKGGGGKPGGGTGGGN